MNSYNYTINEFLIVKHKVTIFNFHYYDELKILINSEKSFHNMNLETNVLKYKNDTHKWWTDYISNNYPKEIYNCDIFDSYENIDDYYGNIDNYYKNNSKNKYIKYINKSKIDFKNIIYMYIIKEFNWNY
jgi:hypothetical protein